MIQKTIRSAILGIIAVLSISATPSLAFNGYVDVTNNTGYDIYYLYISNDTRQSRELHLQENKVVMRDSRFFSSMNV